MSFPTPFPPLPEQDLTADLTVDTSGTRCPLPILKAKKALQSLQSGQTLLLRTTDRSAPRDFTAFCRQSGHTLVGVAAFAANREASEDVLRLPGHWIKLQKA